MGRWLSLPPTAVSPIAEIELMLPERNTGEGRVFASAIDGLDRIHQAHVCRGRRGKSASHANLAGGRARMIDGNEHRVAVGRRTDHRQQSLLSFRFMNAAQLASFRVNLGRHTHSFSNLALNFHS